MRVSLLPHLLRAVCALSLVIGMLLPRHAHAQWQTSTYTLKGGWNAIYLHGDAKQDTIDNVMPASVLEVWRWNSNPTQVQFTRSPLIPSGGSIEWSVWKRGLPAESTLTQLSGQAAYLVKCSGTTANTYSAPIKLSPLPPRNAWVRNGANLLGFPSYFNGSNYPVFSNYFATFPAAIASNSKLYKYIGGDLGAGNPTLIFSPTTERLDRNTAYWFSAEVAGEFYAPLEISSTATGGIIFGRTGSVVTVRVRNRTSNSVTLTLTPSLSEAAPASQPGISGQVPLTRRTYNTSTLTWTETAITGVFTEAIGPQASIELNFGINRALMTGGSDSFYASFLRFTESSALMDVMMPVTASKASLAGLWVGDIALTHVSSRVSNGAKATATISTGGSVSAIAVNGTGGYGYTSAPAVTIADPASGITATATASVANGSVTGFTITNAGSGYLKTPAVTIAPPPPLTGTSTPRSFPMRTLLHVSDDGTARLLSQVFIGQLAAGANNVGLCTREDLLKPETKEGAQRMVAAHMPLDQSISSGSGAVAMPGVLTRTINVPYNASTNPFIHQYHPDHDNLNARFNPIPLPSGVTPSTARMSDGVEAPAITRVCTFTFTTTPPSGSSVTSGWGSSVIGGTYSETITGIHKNTLQMDGTFELRRASEIGIISTP